MSGPHLVAALAVAATAAAAEETAAPASAPDRMIPVWICPVNALAERLGPAADLLRQDLEVPPPDIEELKPYAAACGPAIATEVDRLLELQGCPGDVEQAVARLRGRLWAIAGDTLGTDEDEEGVEEGPAAPLRNGRDVLDEVMARREFAMPRPTPTPKPEEEESGLDLPGWLERLLETIAGWLEPEEKEPKSPARLPGLHGGVAAFSYAAVAAVLALVLVLVYRSLRSRQAQAAPAAAAAVAAASEAEEALSKPAESWLLLAEERFLAGDVAGAVRALYLALLVRLHRDGRIEVKRAQTNWELWRRLSRRVPPASASFRELTALFDRIVYGRRPAAGEDFAEARRLAEAVIAAAAAAAEPSP